MISRALICVAFACYGLAAQALETSEKLQVIGDVLVYDTDLPSDPDEQEITGDDVDQLLVILRDAPDVQTLRLNSEGGSVWASDRMSRVVIDFELDTEVDGVCNSSCVTVFLSGKSRTMTRGSSIGFHPIYWGADSIEAYYSGEALDQGWETPFDFAEWLYADTQQETYRRLSFMVGRGVDAGFAIQTIRAPDDDLWRPSRVVLHAAGVLTE